jgi:hypothetical protein
VAWKVRDGGAWRDVTTPSVVVNGTQRPVVRGLVRVGGAWRRFYPDSEVTSTAITGGLTAPVEVGVARAVTGTVTAVSGSISGGTVTVYQRQDPSSAWVSVGTATPGTGAIAVWSASVTPTLCGDTEFKAVYSGTATYEGSESAVQAVNVIVRAPAQPTGDALGTTTATLSWPAVPGATGYEVRRNGVLVSTQTATTISQTGLAPNTTYSWTVTATRGACKSAASPAKTGKTGQDAVTDTGSATVEIRPSKTNSYRPDVSWGYIGEHIGQGYYQDSGRNYTGCIDYGGQAALQAAVIAALGSNGTQRWANMTVSAARVFLQKRSSAGDAAGENVYFQNSTAEAGVGGAPARNGTRVMVVSAAAGSGKWMDIGTAHWDALKAGTARSIITYDAASTYYAQFDGKSVASNRCNLQLDCSWNYQLTTAVTPVWTN